MADAAVEKQENIKHGLRSFANSVTSAAMAANATWPFFILPDIEVHWRDMLDSTNMEVAAIGNVVMNKDRKAYEDFVTEGHEKWMAEAHMYANGNLERFEPVNYFPFITTLSAENGIVPQVERDICVPLLSYSPP